MPSDDEKLIFQNMSEERQQGATTRKRIYPLIEEEISMPVVCYFTSFRYAVTIADDDADMLEGILQKCDLSKGFALLLINIVL